jgi:hypothetical protein
MRYRHKGMLGLDRVKPTNDEKWAVFELDIK